MINFIYGLPVTTTETNFEPKWPSGDSLHGFGCLFCKSAAMIHSSELKKCDFCKVINLNISNVCHVTSRHVSSIKNTPTELYIAC